MHWENILRDAMLQIIQNKFADELKRNGIEAEVTFFRSDMFSILVDQTEQFERAKTIVGAIPTVAFDSEAGDEECGHVAYYRF